MVEQKTKLKDKTLALKYLEIQQKLLKMKKKKEEKKQPMTKRQK